MSVPRHRVAALLAPLALAACGSGEPEADPAALDQHFNEIIARDEANRAQAVTDARAREAQRMREMEAKVANYGSE
ncbi:MAG: hypothetical protein M3N07_07760 [Pseudomonadota bacterium]|nr:hypothetical protein [Pseudomonadota bacterium]